MEELPADACQCEQCAWWTLVDRDGRHCPYRVEACASNAAWREIRTGRCSHFLALADPQERVSPVTEAGESGV